MNVPTIVALIVDRRERERIASTLRPFGELRFCDRPVEVWQAISEGDVLALVTDARDADRRSIAPVAAELRRLFSTLPIVVRPLPDNTTRSHELTAMALVPGLILLDHNGASLPPIARDQIVRARVQNPRSVLLDTVDAMKPPPHPLITTYLRAVILHARWPLRVRDAVEMLDPTKRRTLELQLKLAHLPTAEQLIGWVFALHATWLSALPGSTFDAVAQRLGFGDSRSLRGIFKNRTGLSPRAVMRQGGFPYLLERFVALLHGDWSREPISR